VKVELAARKEVAKGEQQRSGAEGQE